MPRPPEKRRIKRSRPPSTRPRRLPALLAVVLCALLIGGGGLVGWIVLAQGLPEVYTWSDYARIAPQTTRLLASNGEVLADLWEERRTLIPPADIPPVVRDAVLASEDADFLTHSGIDAVGILRALWVDLLAGRVVQGGSTITQQLAKNLFLSAERTVERKVKEAALAFRLEHRLSKEDILGMYLNQIYMGHGRYGVQAASRFYFGRDVRDVTVDQAAVLAGLIASPERYSPKRHPRASRMRRDRVIRRMHRLGWLDDARFERAMASPIAVRSLDPPISGAWFVDAARRAVTDRLGSGPVQRGGLRIHTTLDARWQALAEAALERGLRRADRRAGLVRALPRVASAGRSAVIESLPPCERDACEGVVVHQFESPPQFEVATAAGRLRVADTPDSRHVDPATGESQVQVGHRVRVIRTPSGGTGDALTSAVWGLGPQGAVVVLDRLSGEVRALVGGERALEGGFNRALHARRSAGSVFKPIVFAAALDSGAVDPGMRWKDAPRSWSDGRGGRWTPRNYDRTWTFESVGLEDAMADSLNGVAVQVLESVTIPPVHRLARELGLKGALPPDLTLALGSASVTPLEMAGAFAVFANGGVKRTPTLIRRVLQPAGTNVWPAPPPSVRILSTETADTLDGLLRAVVERGTGRGATTAGLELAGKTGTSSGARDSWFVGYSDRIVAAVWLGFDDNRRLPRGGGASTALPIWRDIVRSIHALEKVGVVAPEALSR